jgi:glycosyltransferase involved in cell wall biosynthesis
MSQMVATTAKLLLRSSALTQAEEVGVTLCHFTTAHTQLKSRSFHRECLPLAASGLAIRYVAPMSSTARIPNVTFVSTRSHASRVRRAYAIPSLLSELLRQNASVYHLQDPELLPMGFLLKLIFRKRVIYDAYEDFPSMTANKRSLPRFLQLVAAGAVNTIEQVAAHCFDGVMTADPFTLRRLARSGGSKKLVFYNFPNLDFFPRPKPCEKRFDIVYRGGLSHRAGTFVLLEAVKLLAERRPKPPTLLLMGYPDNAQAGEELRSRVRTLGLESSTTMQGRIDHEDMARTLSQARIGICPLQPIPKFLLNIPVKVFEFWACGLPVVASDLPPIRPFFQNARAGFLFQPGNSADLAKHIGWLLDSPVAATQMGKQGRACIEKRFNNEREVRKLRDFVIRIATDR